MQCSRNVKNYDVSSKKHCYRIRKYQIPSERQVVLVKTSNKPDNPDIPIPERYLKPHMEESDYDQEITGIDRAEGVC